MANTNPSTYMLLPVPAVGIDPGPQWATDINSCLTILDQHDHTSGNGVQITPAGLNINTDLPFINNNITDARSVRFFPQTTALVGATDIGCAYELNGDFYYNNSSGVAVQITNGSSLAGATGSISGLVAPASATYVAIGTTFVWKSAATVSANMDAGSIILRNLTASSKGLTLSPPAAMGADYTVTLPALPGSQKIMTMDAAGAMAAPYTIDGTTLTINTNVIGVLAGGIGTTQLANLSVTDAKIASRTITNDKIVVSTITYAEIASLTIIQDNLADNCVNRDKILDLEVIRAKIAANAIDSTKLDTSSVTTPKIADQHVTTAKLALLAVDTAQIAANAVTTAKIANGNVTYAKQAAINYNNGVASLTTTLTPLRATTAGIMIGLQDTSPVGSGAFVNLTGPVATDFEAYVQLNKTILGVTSAVSVQTIRMYSGASGRVSIPAGAFTIFMPFPVTGQTITYTYSLNLVTGATGGSISGAQIYAVEL